MTIILAYLVFLSGCSNKDLKESALSFDEIEIRNNTQQDITSLQIRVTSVHKKFSCSLVIAQSLCSIKFSPRSFRKNLITLSWREGVNALSKGPLLVKSPQTYSSGIYKIVLFLEGNGGFRTAFELQK
jgi:hypothetical protein